MEIKTWTLDTETFEASLNDARTYFLQKMAEENVITNEQRLKMLEYAISISTKDSSKFGAWLTNLIFKKKFEKTTNTRFVVVKVFYEKETEEPSKHIKEEPTDAEQAN